MASADRLLVGVIADTHGYLDPELARVFRGVDRILHAGDVGSAAVLEGLACIAPVTAVRGNNDRAAPLLDLPELIDLEIGAIAVQLVHQVVDARPGPQTRAILFGHSHRTESRWRENILYLNPGAAGRQGFHLQRTVALLSVGRSLDSTIVHLGPKSAGAAQKSRRER